MSFFSFPLLAKELIELSAHKRTYIFRTIFAILVYGLAIWGFRLELGSWNASGLESLGRGRSLYFLLAKLEFASIFLFLPAMTSGALTAEKERDTLGLLLITKLGPWAIVFEKLASRLVLMGTYLMIFLPLMAIAFALGGIELLDIHKLNWVLFVTTIQVGSISILCSAWFRTTSAAFLASYLIGAVVTVSWGWVFESILPGFFPQILESTLSLPSQQWLLFWGGSRRVTYLALGPLILNGGELVESLTGERTLPNQSFSDCVVMSLPLLGASIFHLVLARMILWKRAFVPSENRISNPLARLELPG